MLYAVRPAVELVKPAEKYSNYKYVYTERDLERIEEFSSYAEEYLEKTLNMNADEVAAWIDGLSDEYGNIRRDDLRKYLRENIVKE